MNLDKRYLEKIENVEFQPIFILGFHRSGTSILYKMLNATKCFNYIKAYHVINYDQLLYNHINNKEPIAKKELNNFLREHGQIDRLIDELKLSADFPEEYRFVFTKKSYSPKMKSKTLPLFINFCKKIQFISNKDKPLLLKSAYDFSNFMFIKQKFPEAKFIFIHRDPLEVINSNINTLNTLFKKKNMYTTLLDKNYEKFVTIPLYFFILKILLFSTTFFRCVLEISYLNRALNYYLTNIEFLDEENYICIRYEDLCKQPDATISKIMNFLKLKPKDKINYGEFIQPRKIILLKELQQLQPYIEKKMKKYLHLFEYIL